jgi:small subunit ribosomal protein S16
MAVHIRLARAGAKKTPFYRIVVTDHRAKRDGRFIENIGTFDPSRDASFRINTARLDYWKSVGAQTTPTVAQLIKRLSTPAAATPAS